MKKLCKELNFKFINTCKINAIEKNLSYIMSKNGKKNEHNNKKNEINDKDKKLINLLFVDPYEEYKVEKEIKIEKG